MFPIAPIATEEASLADSAARLERNVAAAGKHLDQYEPTIALASDGRLFLALAENNHQATARYPVLSAPPLPNLPGDNHRFRLARASAEAQRLQFNLAPFQPQHLPGEDGTMIIGLAMPLGFMAVRGLDVNWNGTGWTVSEGRIRASLHHSSNRDFTFEATEHPASVRVFYVRYATRWNSDGTISVTDAQLQTSQTATFNTSTRIARDDQDYWMPGYLCSPLAYCVAPDATSAAPLTLRIGQGEVPYSFTFGRPTSAGGTQP